MHFVFCGVFFFFFFFSFLKNVASFLTFCFFSLFFWLSFLYR